MVLIDKYWFQMYKTFYHGNINSQRLTGWSYLCQHLLMATCIQVHLSTRAVSQSLLQTPVQAYLCLCDTYRAHLGFILQLCWLDLTERAYYLACSTVWTLKPSGTMTGDFAIAQSLTAPRYFQALSKLSESWDPTYWTDNINNSFFQQNDHKENRTFAFAGIIFIEEFFFSNLIEIENDYVF